MARANRLSGHGGVFHVTHRCHNREFLLKFARDRDGYRAKLREHLPHFDVVLLDYCITSNHVDLLLDADERMQISGLMRTVAGESARAYNRRKQRMNAFWGDNFHATLVEEGSYLWRCLCYIELVQQDGEIWVLQEASLPYSVKDQGQKTRLSLTA